MTRQIAAILFLTTILLGKSYAQDITKLSDNKSFKSDSSNIFLPISKYIQRANVECLSAWFSDNLRVDILGDISNCSKQQAKQILRKFFDKHTPRSFKFIYKSGDYPMEYAVGQLDSGGDMFSITILVHSDTSGNYIQQLKIAEER